MIRAIKKRKECKMMRIDNHQQMKIAQEFQNQVRKNEETKRMNQKDEVKVGAESDEIKELVDILELKEAKRKEKVEATMQELKNGTYDVSGRDVLLKILEDRKNGYRPN